MAHAVDQSWFLIVDPEPSGPRLADALRRVGLRVDLSAAVQDALSLLRKERIKPAVILLEEYAREGLAFRPLPVLHKASPASRFVILTAYGSIANAVQALRLGAENYLCKPISAGPLLHILGVAPRLEEPSLQHPSLDRAIWEYIHFVLAEEGTVAGAARRLGLHARSLRRMLQKSPPGR